jgi:hypothetical protein
MALAEFKKQTRTFDLKGGSFTVEGLSFDKFATLIREHLSDVEAVFNLVDSIRNGTTDLTETDVEKIIIAAAEEAPGLVTNIIVLASGEEGPEAINGARNLPLPVQLEVILTVVDLTFSEVGGIKKAWETITSFLKK